MSRPLKVSLQVLVSGAVIAFLLWRIDLGQTVDILRESNYAYVAGALAIFLATTWLMAWRWWVLLASKGVHEPFGWLLRLYFVGYAASQVLPTAVGGDAVRIIEHARRRPDARAEAAGAVVMERILGSAGTLVLVALGLAVAAGRYEDVRLLIVLEVVFVAAMIVLGLLLFSRRLGLALERRLFPLGRRIGLERPLRSLYWAMHEYRLKPRVLLAVLGVTVVSQFARVIAIWLCGEAVGIDLSPLVYVILGPLLFLVQMVPFTLNGLGVREAFFVVFLGRFGVEPDAAFAAGFLYYAVSIAISLPGGFILLWRSVRPAAPAS
ncbi:MAG: lysylphosphatidylglycerol synthase transmembrane domain-containing protein [Gaiellaceae bacterium]